MTGEAQAFFICLISGLLLVGAEIFVPGGILGTVGALALVGATAMGFVAYPEYGPQIMIGIVLLVGLVVAAWLKFFPGSRLGRSMSVESNLEEAKATEDGLGVLLGKQGRALSDLRPAGFATIEGRRVDVVTQGGMVHDGAPIKVVRVEGNRVVVNAVSAPPEESNEAESLPEQNG